MTNEQANCPHGKSGGRWVKQEDNWYTGEPMQDEYEETYESWFVDISLHQYQCKRCKLIFNYSGGNPHHVLEKE